MILITLLCLTTISCHNMCKDMEETIGEVCWYDKLEWKDATLNSESFKSSAKFYYDPSNNFGVCKEAGNWVVSKISRDVKGFEMQVKLVNGTKAGIELFASNNYQCYLFFVNNQNQFVINYNDGKSDSKDVQLYKMKITNSKEFNTIKTELTSDRSMNVYFNGEFCCNIPDHKINYGLFTVFASGSGNPLANYKLNKILH